MEAERSEQSFRTHVRNWLTSEFSKFKAETISNSQNPNEFQIRKAWDDIVCSGGWSGLCWPKEYGGQALPQAYYVIFLEEYARLGCPRPASQIGRGILGPMLLKYGSESQKRRYIPPLLRNEEFWCQGYSEPHAGSDLAGLSTSAERVGDHYVVNGHKIWTSEAQYADYCFLLARTQKGSQRHEGISFLLVDMSREGVRVSPIRQLTGEEDFCEVWYENVKVPVDDLVGVENSGWKMAMAAANFERATYFVPRLIELRQEVSDLWQLARQRLGQERLQADPLWQERLVQLSVATNSLQLIVEKTLSSSDAPGAESSYSKLLYSETLQAVYDCALELVGERATVGPGGDWSSKDTRWSYNYAKSRGISIAGGTSEIHRNVISEKLLGLPK